MATSSTPGSGRFNLLDQLAEEFAERYRNGERPSLKEYTDRYPELAREIRDLFPALVEIQVVEDDWKAATGVPDRPARATVPPALVQLGDFRIIGEIGHGGMGVVYEAEQVSLGRRVALKVLSGHAKEGAALERFRREARSAARLHHTNIVPVFEVGQHGNVSYYAMQFIPGQGLDRVIDELRRLRDQGREDRSGAECPASSGRPVSATAELTSRDMTRKPRIPDAGLDRIMSELNRLTCSLLSDRFTGSGEDDGTPGSPVPRDLSEAVTTTMNERPDSEGIGDDSGARDSGPAQPGPEGIALAPGRAAVSGRSPARPAPARFWSYPAAPGSRRSNPDGGRSISASPASDDKSPPHSPTPMPAALSIAISSPPTSCWIPREPSGSPTLAWPSRRRTA